MPEIDPVLLDKYNKQALLSDPPSGKQPIKPFFSEPFAFESYNWAGLEVASSANTLSPSSTALRLWAKYFSSKDHGLPFVSIPSEWMDFFTLLLLKDSSNEWATQFLKSQAWTHLSNFSSGNCYTFSLPISKPSVISELCCSDHADEQVGPSDPFQTIEGHSSDR